MFELGGEAVDFSSTADSKAAGVAVIYQEPTLFPDLSVTENIFMGRQPLTRGRRIDRQAMYDEAERLFGRLGVRIDPRRPAEGLSIADQQIIEIAKAISLDARLLVMDEPTAALSGVEVDRLFAVARSLRDEGRALVFISHRFDEVFALADTVTVMRDGSYIDTRRIEQTSPSELVSLMVGRDVDELFPKVAATIGEPVLQVSGLYRAGVFHDVDLEVRAGEIVGLAGLVGAGRSEVARAVFGVDPYDSGSVRIGGREVKPNDPRAAIRAGMAFIPEDRRKQGLVIDSSVTRNVAGVIRRGIARAGLLTSSMEKQGRRSLGRAPGGQDQRARHERGHDERRQPAEGRHRQVARDRPQAADHRRAHPRHRRRHQGRGPPPALRARRPGARDPDDLLRAPRGPRHGRPRARPVRGPHHRRARPRRRHPRGRHARGHPPPRGRLMSTQTPDAEVSTGEALLVEPSRMSPTRRAITTVLRSRELSIFLVLVAVVVLATTKNNSFLFSSDGWRNFLLNPSILLLLAVGQAS